MSFKLPQKTYKSSVRKIELDGVTIGGEAALNFMDSEMEVSSKPVLVLEALMNLPKNFSPVLAEDLGEVKNDMLLWAKSIAETDADMLALRFNIEENSDIDAEIKRACDLLKQIQSQVDKPMMLLGSLKKEIDVKLLPELSVISDRPCVFGAVEDDTYKAIVPSLVENNHYVVARTPIDINLAKELNILITEQGMDADKIIIDPNMGALGYGLDYGYSIIERIKLAGLDGDKMLNMPILAFAGEEAWKSKETKSADFETSWGDLRSRALAWETMTASSVMAAGANILVLWHPKVLESIKKFISR